MKIALGTVQFGMDYGVANAAGRVTSAEAGAVLRFARQSGIDTLDTAIAYGDSELVLGAQGVRSWKIITKLPALPHDCDDVQQWVTTQVQASLQRLGVEQLYGLMLHRPAQLLDDMGPALSAALLTIKAQGLVRKLGVSIYSPDELETLSSALEFDLVQAPLNILDRRLVESGWAEQMHRAGIEVHVRSAFLQGLLLMPAQTRPDKFRHWENLWQEWDRWLAATGLTPLQACLRYAVMQPTVDKVVVGVDTLNQLKQIVNATHGVLTELPEFAAFVNESLINPACWHAL